MTVRRVDITDTDGRPRRAATAPTCSGLESPTNPLLEVADLPALVAAAHEPGATRRRATTRSPRRCVQRPLALGADVVVHSVTKYLAGHSDVVLGATVTARHRAGRAATSGCTGTGRCTARSPGPMEAWLALRGLRTLHLRVERASANAAELARRLAGHPAVRAGRATPASGAIVAIEVPRRRRGRRARSRVGDRGCGCTRRAWAAWSRRSSGGAGTPRSR